jgi:hypothetical protein
MTLKNLLGISLDTINPDKAQLAKLLAAAQRNITDAQLQGLSTENRFDAAYKAIMQLAMVALNVNGYRTLTSKPGHHQNAIQTLPLTVGLAQAKVVVLDALRKQRNLADYSGDLTLGGGGYAIPGKCTGAAGSCPCLAGSQSPGAGLKPA